MPEKNLKIQIADSDEAIRRSFAVMSELRPDYTPETYLRQVRKQMDGHHYRIATLADQAGVQCVAGFRITESLAWKKFMYVDDLVTANSGRSSGYGKHMLDWLIDLARENGCGELHLDSGVQRHSAHRFYLRERMDITCYHFMRVL